MSNKKRARVAVGVLGAVLCTVFGAALPASAGDDGARPKIVGGSPASTDDFPWMVTLSNPKVFPDRPSGQACGGTLVRPDKVVTAAHCADERVRDGLRVIAGRTDLRTKEGNVREVTGVWSHELVYPPPRDGMESNPGGDVAVLTLDRPLPQRPLPIADADDDALTRPGSPARALGWGATDPDDPQHASPILQQAQLPTLPDKKWTDRAAAYNELYDPSHYIGTGYEHGTVGTLPGDSGGPLVAGGKLVGIDFGPVPRSDPPDPADMYTLFTEVGTWSDEIEPHLDD